MLTILSLDLGRFNQQTHGASFSEFRARGPRFRCATNAEGLTPVFAKAKAAGVTKVYFEAQPAAFKVADLVHAHGLEPVIANTYAPGFVAHARSSKSDSSDVDRLGGMALRGEVTGIHIPDAAEREGRALVEHRASLVRDQTAVKNRIRGLAEKEWLELPEGELCWTQEGLAKLRARSRDRALPESLRICLGQLLEQLRVLGKLLASLERVSTKRRATNPAAQRLVEEMPGFGPATTDAFLAFVGNPATTGYASRSAAALVGLAPTQRQSGKTVIQGGISKAGNATLRGYLIEAAQVASHRYPEWKALKQRLTKGKDDPITTGKAIVAIARRLVVTAFALLRSGKPYDPERIMPLATWSTESPPIAT